MQILPNVEWIITVLTYYLAKVSFSTAPDACFQMCLTTFASIPSLPGRGISGCMVMFSETSILLIQSEGDPEVMSSVVSVVQLQKWKFQK